jgi:hypothetical protein
MDIWYIFPRFDMLYQDYLATLFVSGLVPGALERLGTTYHTVSSPPRKKSLQIIFHSIVFNYPCHWTWKIIIYNCQIKSSSFLYNVPSTIWFNCVGMYCNYKKCEVEWRRFFLDVMVLFLALACLHIFFKATYCLAGANGFDAKLQFKEKQSAL